jgi:hypothetical protein
MISIMVKAPMAAMTIIEGPPVLNAVTKKFCESYCIAASIAAAVDVGSTVVPFNSSLAAQNVS